MRKPRRLDMKFYKQGSEIAEKAKINTLLDEYNNLVEVVNYLWDHVQSNNAELIDLTDD